jgi:SAM-dependent methyltransferase
MALDRYGEAFYRDQSARSETSARVVVAIVNDVVKPRTVADVGCGTGAWLKVFKELGVERVLGIEGGNVPPSELRIAPEEFVSANLTEPFPIEGPFDLVISLEVAEHLDADAADQFIKRLVALGPVVLFSAAIPHQGGTHHVNEQWPSYWVAKFAEHGYRLLDCVRPAIWDSKDVEIHYAQNTLLFLAESITTPPDFAGHTAAGSIVDMVHPRLFSKNMRHPALAWLTRRFPVVSIRVKRALRLTRGLERPGHGAR